MSSIQHTYCGIFGLHLHSGIRRILAERKKSNNNPAMQNPRVRPLHPGRCLLYIYLLRRIHALLSYFFPSDSRYYTPRCRTNCKRRRARSLGVRSAGTSHRRMCASLSLASLLASVDLFIASIKFATGVRCSAGLQYG